MTTTLENFNLVLVGENFPVSTLDIGDFTFRGRKFKEDLRIGPALQASSRNVQIFAVPDRFQIGVNEPDDLDILVQGFAEVVGVFREYIGRRSVTAVGHNAQAYFTDPGGASAAMSSLVRKDVAAGLLGVADEPAAAVNLVSKVGRESTLTVVVSADENMRGVLSFNFDFKITDGECTLEDAIGDLSASLAHAERIQASFKQANQVTA